MYRIILLGPQGSGKGTQGALLAKHLDVPLISVGDLWRAEIAQGTELGKQAQAIVAQGQLAPDEWTASLVRRRLEQPDVGQGFILDGYPRNQKQFDLLDDFLAPTQVLALTLSDTEAVQRLRGRLVCPGCGSNYHTAYNPPQRERASGVWLCDRDERALTVREDDKPEAVQKRLHIYHTETEPLFQKFRARGIFHEVNSAQSIAQVQADILKFFKN